MNRTCAIYDNNENYARRLMHAMSMKANQQFNIELFTQKDAFEKYLRDGSPTVAMVSESGFYDGISDLYDGSLVVLTEEPEMRQMLSVLAAMQQRFTGTSQWTGYIVNLWSTVIYSQRRDLIHLMLSESIHRLMLCQRLSLL